MKIRITDSLIFHAVFFCFTIALFNLNTIYSYIGGVLKWPVLILAPALLVFKYQAFNTRQSSVFLFTALYLLVASISTVISPALNVGGIAIVIGYYLIFLTAFFCITNESKVKLICNSLGKVSNITVWLSIFLIVLPSSWYGARFSGLHSNPNGMGSCAVIALIYAVTMYFKNGKNIYLLSIIVSFLAIWLTQSRGAFLGTIVFLITYLILDKDFKNLLLFFIVGTLAYFSMDIVNSLGFFEARNIEVRVDDVRMQFILKYLGMIQEKPLFGFGLSEGTFSEQGRFSSELAYLDILTSVGLIGFIFLILALINRIYQIGILIYTNRTVCTYEKCGLFMFVSILIMSIGDGYLSNLGNPLSIFIWLYLGAAMPVEKYNA